MGKRDNSDPSVCHTRPQTVTLGLPSLGLVVILTLTLSACNIIQGPTRGGGLTSHVPVEPNAELSAAQRVQLALSFLEQGRSDEARSQLTRALEQNPDRSAVARRLLLQLDEPPEALLGPDSFSYEVQPGESLSLLADRYLGDEILFYALARYNGISVPNRVSAGRTLKMPIAPGNRSGKPRVAGGSSIEENANAPVRDWPKTTAGSAEDASMPGRIHLLRAEKLAQQGDVLGAREHLALARMFIATDNRLAGQIDGMERDLDRREAQFLIHQSHAALGTGDTERAHRLLSRSVTLDPTRADAREQLASATSQLVDEYHRIALGHLRGGHECSAMDVWGKILLIEPGNPDALSQQRRVQSVLDAGEQQCLNV